MRPALQYTVLRDTVEALLDRRAELAARTIGDDPPPGAQARLEDAAGSRLADLMRKQPAEAPPEKLYGPLGDDAAAQLADLLPPGAAPTRATYVLSPAGPARARRRGVGVVTSADFNGEDDTTLLWASKDVAEGIDGALAIDHHAAQLLESLGPRGAETAGRLREKSRDRWARWTGAAPDLFEEAPDLFSPFWTDSQGAPGTIGKYLFQAVWEDVVRPQLEAEMARAERAARMPAAMLLPFAESIDRTRDARREGDRVVVAGESVGQLELLDAGVPVAEVGLLSLLADKGFAAMSSLNFERLVWWLPHRARQLTLEGSSTTNVIRADSWAHLAHMILQDAAGKEPRAQDIAQIKALVVAMYQHPPVQFPDRSTSRLIWLAWGPRDDPFIRITLPDPWVPWTAPDLPRRGRSARRARALAPVIAPPPGLGGPKGHAWQAALSRRLVLAMSQRRDDVRRQGALVLGEDGLEEMAVQAGAKRRTVTTKLAELAEHWRRLDHMLIDPGGRVRLGGQHADKWRFLTAPRPRRRKRPK